jgi:hypothetical protein
MREWGTEGAGKDKKELTIRDEKREEVAYVGEKSIEEPVARRVELAT